MSTTTLNNKNTFLQENKTGFVVLFILFLLSSVGMFGQEVKSTLVVENESTTVVTSTEITIADGAADIEFMTWFMGSNQSKNTIETSGVNDSSAASRKKQIISSGATPNRLLYRTLVKKVASQANAIV